MAEYTIQQISSMFHIPSSTLRYYEESGLLPNVKRNASGQRIFTNWHVNRIKSICCFKNTGMTITQMNAFFSYEDDEAENIDKILLLLKGQKTSLENQMQKLEKDYAHIQKKLRYYSDIKECLHNNQPRPKWEDYSCRE